MGRLKPEHHVGHQTSPQRRPRAIRRFNLAGSATLLAGLLLVLGLAIIPTAVLGAGADGGDAVQRHADAPAATGDGGLLQATTAADGSVTYALTLGAAHDTLARNLRARQELQTYTRELHGAELQVTLPDGNTLALQADTLSYRTHWGMLTAVVARVAMDPADADAYAQRARAFLAPFPDGADAFQDKYDRWVHKERKYDLVGGVKSADLNCWFTVSPEDGYTEWVIALVPAGELRRTLMAKALERYVNPPAGHFQATSEMAFSADSTLLACVDEGTGTVTIMTLPGLTVQATVKDLGKTQNLVQFSADGSAIAIGLEGGAWAVADTATGATRHYSTRDTDPAARYLWPHSTAAGDQSVRLAGPKTLQRLNLFTGEAPADMPMAKRLNFFTGYVLADVPMAQPVNLIHQTSADGAWLSVGLQRTGRPAMLNLQTGAITPFPAELTNLWNIVLAGDRFISRSLTQEAAIGDIARADAMRTLPTMTGNIVGLSPDGTRIAMTKFEEGCWIMLHDAAGTPVHMLGMSNTWKDSIRFSPDGRWLVRYGRWSAIRAANVADIWDLSTLAHPLPPAPITAPANADATK